ncbi:MAG: hypothetical protein KA290_14830 [Chitinophagaceae bacterium]|nr:hypothetical protein [Chitinophagaceae bacterium]
MKTNNTHLNKFVRSYLATGCWVEFESDQEYTVSFEAMRQAFIDCEKFLNLLDKNFMTQDAVKIATRQGKDLPYRAGHDLYLTRNRHGAGFWDGDWDELGDKLTEICHEMKECQLYLGDDGKAYFM